MAIASVGTLGVGASSTSNASWTFTTATNTLASGDFALLYISTDNIATVDGVSNNHTSVSGGTGYWTKVGEYTNTVGGAAGDGVTVSLWLFEATGTLALSTTITMNLSGSVTDKACSFWKFTKGANTSIALDTAPTTNPVNNTTDASNGFGSAAFSGLASAARLYVRALGKEANSTTNITVSTSFTAITNNRSRNNASAVGVWGEFRINTSTGETSNPTLAVSGDTAGIFASLIEVAVADPTTLTDNFDDNSKDATKWGTDAPFGRQGLATSGTVSETNQRTEVLPTASTAGFAGRRSTNYYDMEGKRIYVRMGASGTLPTNQEAYIGFGWSQSKFAEALAEETPFNRFYLYDGSDNSSNRAGTFVDSGVWVGIRHNVSDDTLHVETAPASEDPPATWTDLGGVTRDQRIPLKGVMLGFGAGNVDASVSSPVTIRFDGFNTATSTGSAGSASGTGSATAVPIVSGASSGTGAATGVGKSTAVAAGSASGTGSASGVGLAANLGSASGTGSATAVGQSTASSPGSASGTGAATGVGASTALSPGAAAGSGAATGVGRSQASSAGAAAGIGAASATPIVSGAAAGSGSATGVGASSASAVGSAAGIGAASAVGGSQAASAGAASGTGAASGVGRSNAAGDGAAAGVGSATGVGSSLARSAGAAAGVGAATGVSGTPGSPSVGAASGTGSASAVGQSTAAGDGAAAGIGAATGSGSSQASGQGSATGTATASGAGSTLSRAAGASSGAGAATGAGAAVAMAGGASTGLGTANANGTGLFTAAGSASGSSTASATSSPYSTGVGLSAGFGVAVGAGQSIARAVGFAAGIGSASAVGQANVVFADGSVQSGRIGHVNRQPGDSAVGHSSRVAAVGARLRTGTALRAARTGQVIRRR